MLESLWGWIKPAVLGYGADQALPLIDTIQYGPVSVCLSVNVACKKAFEFDDTCYILIFFHIIREFSLIGVCRGRRAGRLPVEIYSVLRNMSAKRRIVSGSR